MSEVAHVLREGSGGWCAVDCPHPLHKEAPSIFGRERALIDTLAGRVYRDATKIAEHTALRNTRRGSYFEVRVVDPEGKWDGHVARITIELDRMEDKDDDDVPLHT